MYKAILAFAAVVAASALLVPTISQAATGPSASDEETVSASVLYADLNLARQHDVDALRGRINYAARTVCGRPFSFEVFVSTGRRQCIDGAVASAQPAFDSLVNSARHGVVTVGYGAALIVSAPRQ